MFHRHLEDSQNRRDCNNHIEVCKKLHNFIYMMNKCKKLYLPMEETNTTPRPIASGPPM